MLRLSSSCSGPITRVKVLRWSESTFVGLTALTAHARRRSVSSAISPKYLPGAAADHLRRLPAPGGVAVHTTAPSSTM